MAPVSSWIRCRRVFPVPAERVTHRAGRYFRSRVFVGVGVGGVLLSDGAPPSQYSPGRSRGWEARGVSRRWPGTVPGWASSGESGVPDLAVPGTGGDDGRRRFHSSGAPVRSRTCPAGPAVPTPRDAGDRCASYRVFLPLGLRGGSPKPVYPPDRRRSVPTRWTASCRLWRRWLLGGTALDTCYGAAGVSMWNQRERSLTPCSLMALIR